MRQVFDFDGQCEVGAALAVEGEMARPDGLIPLPEWQLPNRISAIFAIC